jgi:hypothetical protein
MVRHAEALVIAAKLVPAQSVARHAHFAASNTLISQANLADHAICTRLQRFVAESNRVRRQDALPM